MKKTDGKDQTDYAEGVERTSVTRRKFLKKSSAGFGVALTAAMVAKEASASGSGYYYYVNAVVPS